MKLRTSGCCWGVWGPGRLQVLSHWGDLWTSLKGGNAACQSCHPCGQRVGTFGPTALNSRKEKDAGGWIHHQWPDDLINLLKWKTLIKPQRMEHSDLAGWWPHGDSASMLSSERAPCSLPKPFPTLPVHLFHLNVPELCPLQESLFSWTPKSLQTVIAWNQKMPASWRESYDKSRQCINKRRYHLQIKVHIVKAMVFPVVMYRPESWTIKKAECWRIDAFKLWCWRRLLWVPWTARRSNQSILKEINPEYSLEGLTLKLQCFDRLMGRANSLEKTLMLG